jgi:hypothetical protein
MRQALWAIRVIVDEITVVRFDNAELIGLSAQDLVSDDWSACQDAADRIRADRKAPKAIQVPNAALPGTQNLVILEERVAIPYTWEPIDDGDLPVALAAANSQPPRSLADAVRQRGAPHPEFEAWQAGAKFKFVEPKVHELLGDLDPDVPNPD